MTEQKRCELRVQKEYDLFVVRDQDGRQVRGVRAVSVNQRINDVTTATIEVILYVDGEPVVPK